MKAYNSLAGHYDSLTADVDYEGWADFLLEVLDSEKAKAESVLDLACGTGSMSCLLARRGYDVIGVDASAEMLSIAYNKAASIENRPLFLNQDITRLDLYGTVDLAICCLDSLNYLTEPDKVQSLFGRLKYFVNPGGVFLFDVLTQPHMKSLDGQTFIDENEDVFCVWRAEYSEDERLLSYAMDIFSREGGLWTRNAEEHRERAYLPGELKSWLEQSEFHGVKVYGDKTLRPPEADEQRIFISARRNELV